MVNHFILIPYWNKAVRPSSCPSTFEPAGKFNADLIVEQRSQRYYKRFTKIGSCAGEKNLINSQTEGKASVWDHTLLKHHRIHERKPSETLESHEKLKSELTPSSTHTRQQETHTCRKPASLAAALTQVLIKLLTTALSSLPCTAPICLRDLSSGTQDQAVLLEQKHQPSKGWWKGCTTALPQCQQLQRVLLPCPALPSRPAAQRVPPYVPPTHRTTTNF